MDNTREKLIELLEGAESAIYWNSEDKSFVEKIADHLIANGVLMPPCKVGQEIWMVYSPKHPANPNDKGKWFMVQDGVQRIIYGAKGLSVETWNMGTIPAKEIGKKLFFTQEEAEATLQNRQRGNDYEKYHVATGDGKGYYGVNYETYREATELLKISQSHDPQAHIIEEEYYFTNADRIRAMSDEELRDFLSQYKFCDICEEGCDACIYHGDCDKRLLEWLKQPVEE